MSSICHKTRASPDSILGKQSGAYTVRYLFVIWNLFDIRLFSRGVPIDSLYVSRYSVIQNVYTKKQTDGIATRHFRFTNSQGARAWRVARAGNRASNRADYKRRL